MDISGLKAGDRHYMAYVGPPAQYDFMGATQFCLLYALGLRARHCVLDVGCGSLRAGRLFICYLDKGRYFGIEPNKWLIEDAIKNQLGNDLIQLKKPNFDHNEDFRVNFDVRFDFIIAQSIFTHTGTDLLRTALQNMKISLKDDGLIAATFLEGRRDFEGKGWVYPESVKYRLGTINRFVREADLVTQRIPWYHPRQRWYLLAKNKDRLPGRSMNQHLSGAVLFDPEFAASWSPRKRLVSRVKRYIGNTLLSNVKTRFR